MAGFVGRGTIIEFGDSLPGTPATIASVSVTNGVATVTTDAAHSFENYDVVEITGTTAIPFLNDFHLVEVSGASEFKVSNGLFGASGSDTGGTATAQNTEGSAGWVTLASVQSVTTTQTADEVDVSAMDTPRGFREFAAGMVGAEFDMVLNWLPNHASHNIISGMEYLFDQRDPLWWRARMPQVTQTVEPAKAWFGLPLELGNNWSTEDPMQINMRGRITRSFISLVGN